MVLDLILTKTDDGFTAEVPSLKGCECWAHDAETVMEKILDLAVFYLQLKDRSKIKVDKARTGKHGDVYKLIFNKNI